jgi:hypothetical protein
MPSPQIVIDIVSYNIGDFAGIEQFGLRAVEPATFLREIGAFR